MKGKWIPCTERLPDKFDRYGNSEYMLCTAKVFVEAIDDYVYLPEIDYYSNRYKAWDRHGEEVIAWMPIPDPYQDGGERRTDG